MTTTTTHPTVRSRLAASLAALAFLGWRPRAARRAR